MCPVLPQISLHVEAEEMQRPCQRTDCTAAPYRTARGTPAGLHHLRDRAKLSAVRRSRLAAHARGHCHARQRKRGRPSSSHTATYCMYVRASRGLCFSFGASVMRVWDAVLQGCGSACLPFPFLYFWEWASRFRIRQTGRGVVWSCGLRLTESGSACAVRVQG